MIERATLPKCLAHVQSVVERLNTIPILSNVLIEAKEGGLRLMATDLDLQVAETIAAHFSAPGATTVSAHTLFDIARTLPEGAQVELTVAADKMTVTAHCLILVVAAHGVVGEVELELHSGRGNAPRIPGRRPIGLR